MSSLPILSGKRLIQILERAGFEVVRVKGSHFRLRHADGRVTTVPVHKNEDLPKGYSVKLFGKTWNVPWKNFISCCSWEIVLN